MNLGWMIMMTMIITSNAIMIALFVRNFFPVPTESSTSMPLYCLAKRCLRP
ncbi:MAG: hypothetical protein ACLR71_02880 [[Clostridium] scindens]